MPHIKITVPHSRITVPHVESPCYTLKSVSQGFVSTLPGSDSQVRINDKLLTEEEKIVNNGNESTSCFGGIAREAVKVFLVESDDQHLQERQK